MFKDTSTTGVPDKYIGEDVILRRKLYDVDGTVITPGTPTNLQIRIFQGKTIYETYEYGGTDFHVDADDAQKFFLQVTRTITAQCKAGELLGQLQCYVANTDLTSGTMREIGTVVICNLLKTSIELADD